MVKSSGAPENRLSGSMSLKTLDSWKRVGHWGACDLIYKAKDPQVGQGVPHNGKTFRRFSTQWKKGFHSVENLDFGLFSGGALRQVAFPRSPHRAAAL